MRATCMYMCIKFCSHYSERDNNEGGGHYPSDRLFPSPPKAGEGRTKYPTPPSNLPDRLCASPTQFTRHLPKSTNPTPSRTDRAGVCGPAIVKCNLCAWLIFTYLRHLVAGSRDLDQFQFNYWLSQLLFTPTQILYTAVSHLICTVSLCICCALRGLHSGEHAVSSHRAPLDLHGIQPGSKFSNCSKVAFSSPETHEQRCCASNNLKSLTVPPVSNMNFINA